MNPLANELNDVLEGTVVSRLLSRLGRQMYFPKGIVSQSAEAGLRAKRLNATIGMAVEHGQPMVLSAVAGQVPGLDARELASYAPTAGLPELRMLWQKQLLKKNPSLNGVPISLPIVVPGLTNGVFHATELFVEEGTIVIIPDLFWGNYRLIMEVRRGATIVTFPFFNDQGAFNHQGFAQVLTEQSRTCKKLVVCLNFPNNPSGYSPSITEAGNIRDALVNCANQGTDILVINDDAYFGLFFESDTCKESMFALLANAHERITALKIDGATKEDFVWGFRLGFMTFGSKGLSETHYEAVQKKVMGSIRGCVSSSSGLAQQVLLKAYKNPAYDAEKQLKFKELERRYHKVCEIIGQANAKGYQSFLRPLPFNSGYFMTFECVGLNAETLRLELLDREIGTISIGDRYLRIAYSSLDHDRLEELYQEVYTAAGNLLASST